MTFSEIGILGDVFSVASLCRFSQCADKKHIEAGKNKIGICPIIPETCFSADFSVNAIGESRSTAQCGYAAALAAGAFLLRKRGLPLGEIKLDVQGETYNVLNSGDGALEINIDKSEEKFGKTQLFIDGADIECYVSREFSPILIFKTDDISMVSDAMMKRLSSAGGIIKSAVAAYSESNGEVLIKTYTEHIKEPPFKLFLLLEALILFDTENGEKLVSVDGYGAMLKNELFSQKLKLMPQMLN